MSISIVNNFTYTQEVLIDLKFKGFRIGDIPVTMVYHRKESKVVKSIFRYTINSLSIILRSLIYNRPMMAFGLFGAFLCGGGILAKILTAIQVFSVTAGLSTGFIILGIVSFMLGTMATIIFRRQQFAEKDLRHYIKEPK